MELNDKYIDVTLKNFDSAISIYNVNTLSEDLSNYIFKECLGIKLKHNITLRIKPLFKINEEQKERLVKLLRSNYGLDIRDELHMQTIDNIKNIVLMFIGVIFVLLSDTLNETIIVLNEVFLIIGWVAIWEAVYSFMFLDIRKKYKIKRLKQLTKCKIEFV